MDGSWGELEVAGCTRQPDDGSRRVRKDGFKLA